MCSCEKILYYNDDDTVDELTINSIACADTVFSVSVSKVYNYWEMSMLPAMDYWYYEMNYPYGSEPAYTGDAVLKNAHVSLVVNKDEHIPLEYDYKTYSYRGDYIPKERDELKLSIEADGYAPVEAQVQIPKHSKIEVVSCEKKYSKYPIPSLSNIITDWSFIDSVAIITLKINDPGAERNYYRLKVRAANESFYMGDGYSYAVTDIFTSDDIIFKDDQLYKDYKGWPAGFSNIFTDDIFDGEEYVFTVESRLRSGNLNNPYVVVELQSITKELYYYLKSTMLYRITEQDAYTEPIIIASNVKNGLGIFGAVSSDRHVIYL